MISSAVVGHRPTGLMCCAFDAFLFTRLQQCSFELLLMSCLQNCQELKVLFGVNSRDCYMFESQKVIRSKRLKPANQAPTSTSRSKPVTSRPLHRPTIRMRDLQQKLLICSCSSYRSLSTSSHCASSFIWTQRRTMDLTKKHGCLFSYISVHWKAF